MTEIINLPEIDTLATIVEEGARATERGVSRFIEPASGTLRRAVSRRHQIIFGRRGSGKTSLLRKAAADLTVDRRPIAYVDLEPYKGHHYPDVLISVLIASFLSFKEWLSTAAVHPATKKSFWEKFFGTVPKKPAFNHKRAVELTGRIESIIKELENQLHLSDNTELQQTIQRGQENTQQGEIASSLGAAQAAQVTSKAIEAGKISWTLSIDKASGCIGKGWNQAVP